MVLIGKEHMVRHSLATVQDAKTFGMLLNRFYLCADEPFLSLSG